MTPLRQRFYRGHAAAYLSPTTQSGYIHTATHAANSAAALGSAYPPTGTYRVTATTDGTTCAPDGQDTLIDEISGDFDKLTGGDFEAVCTGDPVATGL